MNQEEIKAVQEEMLTENDVNQEELKAAQEEMLGGLVAEGEIEMAPEDLAAVEQEMLGVAMEEL